MDDEVFLESLWVASFPRNVQHTHFRFILQSCERVTQRGQLAFFYTV